MAVTPDEELSGRTKVLLEEATQSPGSRRREILDEVVISHLWLARSLAYRHGRHRRHHGQAEADDLLQVARSGLVEAAQRFDPSRGEFLAFAVPTITGLLRRHFRDHDWAVRPTRHVQEVAISVHRETPKLMQELGGDPTDAQLAERLGESLDMIRQAQWARAGFSAASLHAVSTTSGLPDGPSERAQGRIEAEIMISKALRVLTQDQRHLLSLRFVQEWSQSEIATELGISQMQVSRMLARLLGCLRSEIGDITRPCLSL